LTRADTNHNPHYRQLLQRIHSRCEYLEPVYSTSNAGTHQAMVSRCPLKNVWYSDLW